MILLPDGKSHPVRISAWEVFEDSLLHWTEGETTAQTKKQKQKQTIIPSRSRITNGFISLIKHTHALGDGAGWVLACCNKMSIEIK